jgi:3-oxoacyl-[acyl-carrier protein] reductase
MKLDGRVAVVTGAASGIGLANAAGIGRPGTIAAMTLDEWRRVVDVNLTGVFLCCREAVRAMRPRGNGVIVNVASELALVGAALVADGGITAV